MLKLIVPMEPKETDEIPVGDEWDYEVKWDGVRIEAYVEGGKAKLFNRHLNERTLHYPEVTNNVNTFLNASSALLDGEIFALNQEGTPDFPRVMKRDAIRRMHRVEEAAKQVAITYMVFDLLYLNGEWLNGRPRSERRDILYEIIRPTDVVQISPSYPDGRALFEVMKHRGMEGIISKKKHSPYYFGKEVDFWRKTKNFLYISCVVGGYTLGGDGTVNAVLLGLFDKENQLWYVGHSGMGAIKKAQWRRELTEKLTPLRVADRPFVNEPQRYRGKQVYWVRPELTLYIQFMKWTDDMALWQATILDYGKEAADECVFTSRNPTSSRFRPPF